MRPFEYTDIPAELSSLAIGRTLEMLHEHEALREAYRNDEADNLGPLRDTVLARSAKAMAKLEGTSIDDARLQLLMDGKAEPSGDVQCKATGYVYVRDLVDNRFESMAVSPGVIMQLHRDLNFFGPVAGGRWRTAKDDEQAPRCPAIAAGEIAAHMRHLCQAYDAGIRAGRRDPLILATMFACDLMRISPFPSDNLRIALLLLHELLLKCGWSFISYGCIEEEILAKKAAGEEALALSHASWPEKGSYLPFVDFLLDALDGTFRAMGNSPKPLHPAFGKKPGEVGAQASTTPFPADPAPRATQAEAVPIAQPSLKSARRAARGARSGGSGNEALIRAYFARTAEAVSKAQIMEANTSMSQKTIERILQKLQREGTVRRVGAARATKYQRV
ncbi:Fic family protein [Curtanaerobium respiraculi]|uniref:Fic family protein n=1 Tax=Curtanaerobium respiraculi TaxID=2949669 RepID=UPI0024B33B3D|nr:Fic family protein [Curtanaerobium respiraculi]